MQLIRGQVLTRPDPARQIIDIYICHLRRSACYFCFGNQLGFLIVVITSGLASRGSFVQQAVSVIAIADFDTFSCRLGETTK
ncbi:hypothetical protein D3C74_391430 [compost metagenome]